MRLRKLDLLQWRHRSSLLVCGALIFLLAATASSTALARHTDKEKITDQTAYTLQDNEWRVGLFRAEYGIWDSFSVGTYTFPWALPIYTGIAKWRFYDRGNWSFASRLSFLVLDSNAVAERFGDKPEEGEPSATVSVIPFELATSYKLNKTMTLSAEMVFTSVTIKGDGGDTEVNGAAASSNGQLGLTWEWRWSEVTAFVLHARTLMYQTAQVAGSTIQPIDDYTTVEIVGSGETDALDYTASSLVPSFHWSWDTFNLRFGLGHGNWNFPGVNFVSPVKSVIVDFDLFWRF